MSGHYATTFEQVNKMLESSKARIEYDTRLADKYGADTYEVRVCEGGDGIVTNKMIKKNRVNTYGGRMECECGQTILASTKKEMTFKLRLHSKVCPNEKKINIIEKLGLE